MKVKVYDEALQSTEYRKLFDFINTEGFEPFWDFKEDMRDLKQRDLVQEAVVMGVHPTISLTRKHKDVIEFLRGVNRINLPHFLTDPAFDDFLAELDLKKLETYYENACLLEELKVGSIMLLPRDTSHLSVETAVLYDQNGITYISKGYSDGDISYAYDQKRSDYHLDLYKTSVSFERNVAGFVLKADNDAVSGNQFRSAYIKNFDFDPYCLPGSGELSKMDVPYSLEQAPVYIKRKKN